MFARRSLVFFCATVCLSGCSLQSWQKSAANLSECASNDNFFASQVDTPILLKTCVTCHSSGGAASATRFILVNDASSAGVSYNYAALAKMTQIKQDGTSLLLLKPTQVVSHGGGLQMPKTSPEFSSMSQMIERIDSCPANGAPAVLLDTAVVTPADLPARVRLLNTTEYNNTIAALLADTCSPAAAFPHDESQNEYTNNAAQVSGELLSGLYVATAETLAQKDLASISSFAPCSLANGDAACAKGFIASFGKLAYRRPLTSDDTNDLFALYQTAIANGDTFGSAIQDLAAAMLASPSFLYTTELGDGAGPEVQLTPHEVAAALAYLVTAAPPDAALVAAADANQLSTPDAIKTQVLRLLAAPSAKAQLARFVNEWIEGPRLGQTPKDATLFPQFADLEDSITAETAAFVDEVVWNGDATLTSLLTANYTVVDAKLAKFYGLNANIANGQTQRVPLDGSGRMGLLMQANFLAGHGDAVLSSPIKRGVFIRRRVLCENLPDPPPGVNTNPPAPQGEITTRQLFDVHISQPSCSGCHMLINPIGNGFENFDAVGAYRQTDNGQPVDASGEISGSADSNGEFSSALQMIPTLAKSAEVRACFARNFFRFASAQSDPGTEQRFLDTLGDTVPDSIIDLLVAYATSSVFTNRTVTP